MVSAPARSPLPITAIARAHTRLELNFSSVFVHSASVYLCALVYLCNARHRISRRWRAIPAACNLTLPRPRSATIFYNLPHSQPLAWQNKRSPFNKSSLMLTTENIPSLMIWCGLSFLQVSDCKYCIARQGDKFLTWRASHPELCFW